MRKIRNTGSSKIIGKFPSEKSGQMVEYESQLERDFIYLLENDPKVAYYTHQPLRLNFTLHGKKRVYTPDYLVLMDTAEKHIKEVKPEKKVPRYAEKFKAVKQILKEDGYNFSVVTEKFIRKEPRLSNVKFLQRYCRVGISQEVVQATENFFAQAAEPVLLDDAITITASLGVLTAEFYAMMYRGIIGFDVDTKITLWSNVFFNQTNAKIAKEQL